MELNPNTPRQRNRRTDRNPAGTEAPIAEASQQTAESSAPVQMPVSQQAVPQPYTQPVQSPQPRTVQSMYPQTYQPQVYAPRQVQPDHQVNPAQAGYQARPVQQPARENPPLRQVQPTVQAPIRPRSLPQTNSGWQTPGTPRPQQRPEMPRARQRAGLVRELEDDRSSRKAPRNPQAYEEPKDASARKKLPGWMTTLLSLMLIGVMALAAFYSLMNAYLVTQEKERLAAYNAVLANYHVTEQADGTLRVTWQDAIEYYAAQYNLQPAFVTAIIRNESSFRTTAESNVGARGLMQMMPDTSEWIAGKLGDNNYSFDRMWDAETNIRYGCWYLGYLSTLFGGDPVLVACAYHAGQGEVRSWLGDNSISPDGRTVPMANIPISETKTYAGRVTQAYGIYQSLLYPDSAFAAADAVPAGSAVSAANGR